MNGGRAVGVAVAVAIGLTWQAGCGRGGSGSQGSNGGVDLSVCRAYYEAVNAYFPKCDHGPGVDEPWSNALAPTSDEDGFAAAYCEGFARAPGAESMGDEMQKCAAWLKSPEACNVPYDSVDLSCYLRGSLPAKAPCASGVQCQSGVCAPPNGAPQFCGQCAGLAVSGASCVPQGLDALPTICDVGLVCSALQKCVPPVKEGETCSPDQSTAAYVPCALGLSCVQAPGKGGSVTCVAPSGLGDGCAAGSAGCGPNLDCVNAVCSAAPGEGQPCSTSTLCASGLYCPSQLGIDAGAGGNVCTPIPVVGAGASCALPKQPAWPPQCEAGLQCTGDVCSPFPSVGSKCPSSGCGQWLVCTNGTCQPPDASQCH